jgi:hypothetical protein
MSSMPTILALGNSVRHCLQRPESNAHSPRLLLFVLFVTFGMFVETRNQPMGSLDANAGAGASEISKEP